MELVDGGQILGTRTSRVNAIRPKGVEDALR
jgi:hypothetical protein